MTQLTENMKGIHSVSPITEGSSLTPREEKENALLYARISFKNDEATVKKKRISNQFTGSIWGVFMFR